VHQADFLKDHWDALQHLIGCIAFIIIFGLMLGAVTLLHHRTITTHLLVGLNAPTNNQAQSQANSSDPSETKQDLTSDTADDNSVYILLVIQKALRGRF
jgi:hypothetical protein